MTKQIKNPANFRVGFLLVTAALISLLISGFFFLKEKLNNTRLLTSGIRVQGKIIDFESKTVTEDGVGGKQTRFRPVVEFRDPEGGIHRFTARGVSYAQRFNLNPEPPGYSTPELEEEYLRLLDWGSPEVLFIPGQTGKARMQEELDRGFWKLYGIILLPGFAGFVLFLSLFLIRKHIPPG